MGEIKQAFRPEFLNRIDATVVFRSLREDQIRPIVDLMLRRVQNQLTEQEIVMEATDEAKDLLVEKGFDAAFGARPMRRAIQNQVEDPLAEGLLPGRFQPGDTVVATQHRRRVGDGGAAARAARVQAEELAVAEAES